jgi:hypothetical protein
LAERAESRREVMITRKIPSKQLPFVRAIALLHNHSHIWEIFSAVDLSANISQHLLCAIA